MRVRGWIVTAGAGLVLADASIVTLALPELLRALDTTVEGIAAVIAVYTLVLAAALLPAERWQRAVGPELVGGAGLVAFGFASAACALADSLEVLLVARAVQALGGAAALVAAFELIDGGAPAGRRRWLGAAVLAAAVGPALGGALTQLLEWRAIFGVQVPVAALAALAVLRGAGAPVGSSAPDDLAPTAVADPVGRRDRALRAAALALLSAALTAVLFLLVLLLVAGWAVAPLAAAAAVTVLPLAALVGGRVPGPARARAAGGALLVGAGVLALAWLPDARLVWTIVPQVLAGLGMGMALPAFAGELLPERTAHDAGWLMTVRHAGIGLVLVAVAPLIAGQLDETTQLAKERGVALVLDAPLAPQDKLALAPQLLAGVEAQRPRAGLDAALAAHRDDFDGDERVAYDELAARADATLVTAVGDAFRPAFVGAGALALLAATALLLAGARPVSGGGAGPSGELRWTGAAVASVALVLAVPAGYAALHAALAPEPVVIADPCQSRDLPRSGGLTGLLQDAALRSLDAGACRLDVSREELVLALADDKAAERFEERHGIDPRSLTGLLGGLLRGG